MYFRFFYKFSHDLPSRLLKLKTPHNKHQIDLILQAKSEPNAQVTQELSSYLINCQPQLKIPILHTLLHNGIMQEQLATMRSYLTDYEQIVASKVDTQHFTHDLADLSEFQALLLLREQKMDQAFTKFQESLKYFSEINADDYIVDRIDRLIESMCICLDYSGKTEQCRECLSKGMEIMENKRGKKSPYYLDYMSKLANTYLDENLDKSVSILKEALDILEPLDEENQQQYLKIAIELMIVANDLDENLYHFINKKLKEIQPHDPELAIVYHVVMSNKTDQDWHIWEAYRLYDKSNKNERTLNLIVQQALKLNFKNKEEIFKLLILEIDNQFKDNEQLQYLKCKLAYEVDKPTAIPIIQDFASRNEHLSEHVLELAQLMHKDNYIREAINLIDRFPQHKSFVDKWSKKL